MEMILPEDVSYIINKLEEAGYEAYAVGGCVRDTVLGRKPLDWDITTSAKPPFIKSCFKKTIDTGIQHGTVTVMLKDIGYEVTTYRIDGEYEDGRHPKSVEFTNNLSLDLERRDFTINAMAYNDSTGFVDEFGGMQDLKYGIIRCVGDAYSRFNEDALRMLRAVRFSGQLGFNIEENTKQAIKKMAKNLKNTSAERIRTELSKLLVSDNPGKIREAYKMGMTKVFLPEFDRMMEKLQHNPHHIYTVGEHCIRSVGIMDLFFSPDHKIDGGMYSYVQADVIKKATVFTDGIDKKHHLILCLVMLFHDIAKPDVMVIGDDGIGHFHGHPQKGEKMTAAILKRLSFDNETISIARRLVKHHDYRILPEPYAVRKAAAKIGNDIMPMFFLVQYADILAQNPVTFANKLSNLDSVAEVYKKIIENNAPLCIKDLAVNGNDLIALGIEKGPKIGQILNRLLDIVLENPEENKKELLLSYVDK